CRFSDWSGQETAPYSGCAGGGFRLDHLRLLGLRAVHWRPGYVPPRAFSAAPVLAPARVLVSSAGLLYLRPPFARIHPRLRRPGIVGALSSAVPAGAAPHFPDDALV